MKLLRIRHISQENLSSDNADALKANAPEIIQNIIKTKLNLVQLDVTKKFADLGCTPDQWTEIITEINNALSIQLNPDIQFATPADLITSVAAQVTEPIIAKESFDECIKEADKILNDLEFMTDTSVEGLGTMLKKALISTGDVFRKMGNSFKTSVFRFYKDTKRSEMQMYYDGNKGKISSVESYPYEQFAEINADKPTGLKGTMKDGVDSVVKVYTDLDLYPFMGTASRFLNDAILQISRETGNIPKFDAIGSVLKQRQDILKKLASEQIKIFTNNRAISPCAFKDAYKSMEEFKLVRETLLGLQSRIDETNELNAMLSEMDKTLADISACVESDSEITKDFVAGVLNITKYLAEACSFYGENVSYQLALEHNHILNIQSCWATIK